MNKVKYDPNRYKQEKERLPGKMLASMTSLCCRRCCEIIQWKVDYGKYVPLEQARKCNLCGEKTVSIAYHRICQSCSQSHGVCAKCQKSPSALSEVLENASSSENTSEDVDPSGGVNGGGGSRYSFVDLTPKDPELVSLKGLNTRVLESRLHEQWRKEREDSIRHLRERERRTVLRREDDSGCEASDDSEEI